MPGGRWLLRWYLIVVASGRDMAVGAPVREQLVLWDQMITLCTPPTRRVVAAAAAADATTPHN